MVRFRQRDGSIGPVAGRATRAIGEAEKAGVYFVVHDYRHNPAATSYGLEAAEMLGVERERVHKTLIATIDGSQLVVAVLPFQAELDLKALAAAVGGKKARLAHPTDAERATGYVIGGISPLGQRKRLPTVIDSIALKHQTVYVSAGRRGLELELRPSDLVELTKAITARLARN